MARVITRAIRGKKWHEWGVIAQCRNPYREFMYCPLCKQYEETATGKRYTPKQFKEFINRLDRTNPVYEADSNRRYLRG